MDADWYHPDDASWRQDEDYSPAVAEALHCAHEHIAENPGDGRSYADALKCLEPIVAAPMSRRQRLATLFIISMAYANTDQPTPALEPIDEALELALELDVEPAQLDLLLLRASVNRYVHQMPDAVDDLRACLDLFSIHSEHRDFSATELAMRLEAVLRLAYAEFLVGHFASAEQLLQKAATLIPQVPKDHLAQFTLAWTRALLLRWRGDYELALTSAMEAADGYAIHGTRAMTGRVCSVVGEIALDLAERFRNNHQSLAFDTFLALAEPYIVRAVELAAADDHGSTETMAFITNSRFQLLRGEGGSGKRIAWLEELAHLGAEHQDSAILTQAYTQLGREYEAKGDLSAAKRWYQRALAVLNESKMVALGVWAQRALWRLGGEMGPDNRVDSRKRTHPPTRRRRTS